MSKRKPYPERTDIEKVQSQWKKLSGLHSREEWSGAVVRAATAAEIATNFAIRKEFESRGQLDATFVDSLLLWANGLEGKVNRLLLPLCVGSKKHKTIKKLKKTAQKVNKERNAIVHKGEFKGKDEASAAIRLTRQFVEDLVGLYEPGFKLKGKTF
jgi:hypothetical protein